MGQTTIEALDYWAAQMMLALGELDLSDWNEVADRRRKDVRVWRNGQMVLANLDLFRSKSRMGLCHRCGYAFDDQGRCRCQS